MSNSVLLTGGDSFTGRYVIDLLLKKGFRVFATTHLKPIRETSKDALSWLSLDLEDQATLFSAIETSKPNYCIHLAGLSHATLSPPKAYYAVNTIGTQLLLSALAKASQPKRILLASSATVYGSPQKPAIDETHPVAPNSHYACSKMAMEYLARAEASKLPVTVVRPFNYTGVGQTEDFLIPKIVAHYREKRAQLQLGNIDVSRDFSDVRDVAQAYVELMASNEAPPLVNICSGHARKIRSILDDLQRLSGHAPAIVQNPTLMRANDIDTIKGATLYAQKFTKHTWEETLKTMLQPVSSR